VTNLNTIWKVWGDVCQCMSNYGITIPPGREIAARYALVDPMLRALGWDLSNPMHVRLEWTQAHGLRPDYTFLKNGVRVLYVEAKSWGTISAIKKLSNPLVSKELKKLKRYCRCNSVNMGALTDGGAWYIIDFSNLKQPKITLIDAAKTKTKHDVKKFLDISYRAL